MVWHLAKHREKFTFTLLELVLLSNVSNAPDVVKQTDIFIFT
jgi:hypothetical protein